MANRKQIFDELEGEDIQQYVYTQCTTLSFPEKLMYMMMAIERETAKAAQKPSRAPAVWDSHGTTIVVLESKELEEVWFPKFFGTNCKFKSFTRKLYRWGFKKVRYDDPCATDSADEGHSSNKVKRRTLCFQHPHFQRDEKNLLYSMENITCDKTKRIKAREETRQLNEQDDCILTQQHGYPVELSGGVNPCTPVADSARASRMSQPSQQIAAGFPIPQQNPLEQYGQSLAPVYNTNVRQMLTGLQNAMYSHQTQREVPISGPGGVLMLGPETAESILMNASVWRAQQATALTCIPDVYRGARTDSNAGKQERLDQMDSGRVDQKPPAS